MSPEQRQIVERMRDDLRKRSPAGILDKYDEEWQAQADALTALLAANAPPDERSILDDLEFCCCHQCRAVIRAKRAEIKVAQARAQFTPDELAMLDAYLARAAAEPGEG